MLQERDKEPASPLCPSSTLSALPPAMSHTTASSSPEAVMACVPVAEIAPSVSQPPWPAQTPAHQPCMPMRPRTLAQLYTVHMLMASGHLIHQWNNTDCPEQ